MLADRLRVSQVTIRKHSGRRWNQRPAPASHGNGFFPSKAASMSHFSEAANKIPGEGVSQSRKQPPDMFRKESDRPRFGNNNFIACQSAGGKFKSLFVITNSVPVALELTKAGYDVLLVGGQVRNHSLALLGPMGVKNLESDHVDRAFIGTSGITLVMDLARRIRWTPR